MTKVCEKKAQAGALWEGEGRGGKLLQGTGDVAGDRPPHGQGHGIQKCCFVRSTASDLSGVSVQQAGWRGLENFSQGGRGRRPEVSSRSTFVLKL